MEADNHLSGCSSSYSKLLCKYLQEFRQQLSVIVCGVIAMPKITVAPPRERTVEHGDTVVLSCEAIGVPTPLIVWRLNFGHVGDAPRVTYSTDKQDDTTGWAGGNGPRVSRGQITIRHVRAEDEGAYTCEAINSKGNVFAIPDTILHVSREFNSRFCVNCSTSRH